MSEPIRAGRTTWLTRFLWTMGTSPRPGVLAAALLAVAVFVGGSPAMAAEPLEWDTEITYTIDPDAAEIAVSASISITNRDPQTRPGSGAVYVVESIAIGIPGVATDVAATSGGRDLSVAVGPPPDDPSADYLVAVIDFPNRLAFGESRRIDLGYRLPSGEPRTQGPFRVNPAYVSFAAWAWGDAGRTTVHIIVPERLEPTAEGAPHARTSGEGAIVFSATEIASLDDWSLHILGRDDSALDVVRVPLETFNVVVKAWPEDGWWREQVAGTVEIGLPILAGLVGLDWAVGEPLVITEALDPGLAGYGGWYLTEEALIEVGEGVDRRLVLHELSHVWFDGALFADRWITEGLAEEFASETVTAVGWRDGVSGSTGPSRPDRSAPGAIMLDGWTTPLDATDVATNRTEEYGYNAAWWVMSAIVDRIGIDAVGEVIHAASANEIAYRGAPAPELVAARDDWRRFLDLVEELAAAEVTDLFRNHVVGDTAELADRDEARAAYARLLSSTRWLPPLAVRAPMGDWRFADAVDAINDASAVLDAWSGIEADATALGVTLPPALESAYQGAERSLDDASGVAASLREALDAVARADAAVDADRGVFTTIGLLGMDPASEYQAVATAFERNELALAERTSDAFVATLERADGVGRRRSAWVAAFLAATLATLIVLIVAVARRRRSGAVGIPAEADEPL